MLEGHKFYRQYSIGPYIVDFYCYDKEVAIELDGGQHAESTQLIYDTNRTRFLNRQGIKVIRFWDNEVIKNTEGVLRVIQEHLH